MLQAGMNDHVTKPIDPDQLFGTLQKWIQTGQKDAFMSAAAGLFPQVQRPVMYLKRLRKTQALPKSLPGFDLEDGLKRLQWNEKLYRKLLLDFSVPNMSAAANEIRQALDAKDFDLAHSLIHNLKGLAGNLAATDLQAAAIEMEKQVKDGLKNGLSKQRLNQIFVELKKALQAALKSVRVLGHPAPEKPAKLSSTALGEIPSELAKEAVDRIHDAVEMGDVTRIKSIVDDLKSRSDAVAPLGDKFIQMAEDFDFDGILKLADELDKSQEPT